MNEKIFKKYFDDQSPSVFVKDLQENNWYKKT